MNPCPVKHHVSGASCCLQEGHEGVHDSTHRLVPLDAPAMASERLNLIHEAATDKALTDFQVRVIAGSVVREQRPRPKTEGLFGARSSGIDAECNVRRMLTAAPVHAKKGNHKMTRKPTAKVNEAERLLLVKRKLIKRLNEEIVIVRENADAAVVKIQSRIRIAQTLVAALEKGTLKP